MGIAQYRIGGLGGGKGPQLRRRFISQRGTVPLPPKGKRGGTLFVTREGMLKTINGLPANVIGVSAEGTVTRDDYETVLIPLLKAEYDRGHRVRLLFQLGANFSGYTPGAAWDDLKVGLKYLRLFERCAVVSDIGWIRTSSQFVGSFLPCPTRVFANAELETAVAWLASPVTESKLKVELSENGVLVLRPQGPLRREDFDHLAATVDPWLEVHHQLRGLVICIQHFPGWENIGSVIEHFQFVKSHHRKVRKIALAVDGALPDLISKLAAHFVEAEIKHFPYAESEQAKEWAGNS